MPYLPGSNSLNWIARKVERLLLCIGSLGSRGVWYAHWNTIWSYRMPQDHKHDWLRVTPEPDKGNADIPLWSMPEIEYVCCVSDCGARMKVTVSGIEIRIQQ